MIDEYQKTFGIRLQSFNVVNYMFSCWASRIISKVDNQMKIQISLVIPLHE